MEPEKRKALIAQLSSSEEEERRLAMEALKGDRKGFHSIRINDQWRVVFCWQSGQALDVQIVDYH